MPKFYTTLFLFLVCAVFAQPTPHFMCGNVSNEGGTIPSEGCLHYKAFISSRPDTLYYPEDIPDASFNDSNGNFCVDVSFLGYAQDEIFIVVFSNDCSSYVGFDSLAIDTLVGFQDMDSTILTFSTSIENEKKPRNFSLSISPSPFNSSCKISFDGHGSINIDIYNVIGQPVKEIYDGSSQGRMEFIWHPEGFPAGIYFVRAKSETCSAIQKIIFLP